MKRKKEPQDTLNINVTVERRRKKQMSVILAIILAVMMTFVCINIASYRNRKNEDNIIEAFRCVSFVEFPIKLNGRYTLDTVMWMAVVYALSVSAIWIYDARHDHDLAGKESGSAKWNDNQKAYNKQYTDPVKENNAILSSNVNISMNARQTRRSLNTIVVGGTGTGKTRYYVKPNVLQMNCNYALTDPSGELLASVGKPLQNNGYNIKVFNLVQYDTSNSYNPFHYIRDEPGVQKMINCLIKNTTPPEQHSGDPFWEKSETALLLALCFYLWQHRPEEEQNFAEVMKLLRMAEVQENNERYKSELDKLFLKCDDNEEMKNSTKEYARGSHDLNGNPNTEAKSLEEMDPKGIDVALKQYRTFKQGAGKTAKSILISAMVRLNAFNIDAIARITSNDDIHLEELGGIKKNPETGEPGKEALFMIIPATDTTFNFLVSMLYSQLFETLCYLGETYNEGHMTEVYKEKYGDNWEKELNELKRTASFANSPALPRHVRFIIDEFANIGTIPDFNAKLSTIRKYEISCTVILQSLPQIKNMYKDDWESIISNCDSMVFLGGQDETTTKYISDLLGDQTITTKDVSRGEGKKSTTHSYKKSSRKLILPEELGIMPNDFCIVKIRGVHPFYDRKYDYLDHPQYKNTGDCHKEMKYVLKKKTTFSDMSSLAVQRAQIEKKIEKIDIKTLAENNPLWHDYPRIYAKFTVELPTTSKPIISYPEVADISDDPDDEANFEEDKPAPAEITNKPHRNNSENKKKKTGGNSSGGAMGESISKENEPPENSDTDYNESFPWGSGIEQEMDISMIDDIMDPSDFINKYR